MDLNEELRVTDAWSLKGELTLSCNCEVFCPCVLSLGQSAPTEGNCLTWACVRIDEGHFGETDLGGVKFGFMAEIPGKLGRGNWTVALFVDDKATVQATKALTWIMTGRAGGSTGLLKILVSSFLGVRTEKIVYEIKDGTHIFQIPKIIEGVVKPIKGKTDGENVVIRNTSYWVGKDVTVARAETSRVRAFGRNWNFAGRSAELVRLDWGSDAR